MIRNSFLFLPKVGAKKEEIIREQAKDWDAFLRAEKIKGISEKSKAHYDRKIREARRNLYDQYSSYFTKVLPLNEHWRLYRFFKEDAIFMDIEVSGVERDSYITVIGLFDGLNTKTMIRGVNLDFRALRKELQHYKIIVSYNGSVFDLPFIKKRYPDLFPDVPHFDLRFRCSKAGLYGSLKDVEKQLGIKRNPIIERIYSGDPKKLWRMYLASGDDYYLKLLVEYNEEDVINLQKIADVVYDRLTKQYL